MYERLEAEADLHPERTNKRHFIFQISNEIIYSHIQNSTAIRRYT